MRQRILYVWATGWEGGGGARMGLIKRTPTLQTLMFVNYLTLLGVKFMYFTQSLRVHWFLLQDLFEQRRTDIKLLKVETVTDSHKMLQTATQCHRPSHGATDLAKCHRHSQNFTDRLNVSQTVLKYHGPSHDVTNRHMVQ